MTTTAAFGIFVRLFDAGILNLTARRN